MIRRDPPGEQTEQPLRPIFCGPDPYPSRFAAKTTIQCTYYTLYCTTVTHHFLPARKVRKKKGPKSRYRSEASSASISKSMRPPKRQGILTLSTSSSSTAHPTHHTSATPNERHTAGSLGIRTGNRPIRGTWAIFQSIICNISIFRFNLKNQLILRPFWGSSQRLKRAVSSIFPL